MFLSVAEDIDHLRGWWETEPDDATIRRGSAILRRFLVENVLLRAWREYGFQDQPIIIGPDLIALIGEVDLSQVRIALGGGGKIEGVRAAGVCLFKGKMPLKPKQGPGQITEDITEKRWRILEFIEAPSIVLDGTPTNRRELIKYFANVLGGVHLSPKGRRREEELVRRLNKMRGTVIKIVEKDYMYFELLSIGQLVGKSEDLAKLSQAIRSRERGG